MKIHGIIENDCELALWVDAQKLIQYNIIRPNHLTFAHQPTMQVRGAPARLPVKKWPWVATSPVALQNTPKKATRSTSTKHSRIICCEIFGLKYPMQSLHRCHLPNPPSSANFFFSISSSLLVEWIIYVIVRRLSECLVTGTSQRTVIINHSWIQSLYPWRYDGFRFVRDGTRYVPIMGEPLDDFSRFAHRYYFGSCTSHFNRPWGVVVRHLLLLVE